MDDVEQQIRQAQEAGAAVPPAAMAVMVAAREATSRPPMPTVCGPGLFLWELLARACLLKTSRFCVWTGHTGVARDAKSALRAAEQAGKVARVAREEALLAARGGPQLDAVDDQGRQAQVQLHEGLRASATSAARLCTVGTAVGAAVLAPAPGSLRRRHIHP